MKMQRSIPTILLMLAVALTGVSAAPADPTAQHSAQLDADYGFRDMRFGMPIGAVDALLPVETPAPDTICYERRGDDMRLGDGRMRSIRYCFLGGRLDSVLINAEGERNTDALLHWLEQAYGRGQRDSAGGEARRLLWQGRDVSAFYGEPRGRDSAQARLWVSGSEVAPSRPPRQGDRLREHRRPPHDAHRYENLPSAGELQIGAARRVRRGLVTQVSVRYRGLAAPGMIRILLPPELEVESSIPQAQMLGDELVWEGLANSAGNLKFKAMVRADSMPGAVLVVRGALFDTAGGRTEASATMRAQ